MNQPSRKPNTALVVGIAGVAALFSTMLGIGGGLVMVPALTLLARVPIKRTVGTSLAVIFLGIVVGVIAQEIKRPGDIHWDVSLLLATGALLGTFLGKWLNEVLPERVFRYAFCGVMIVVGARLLGVVPRAEPFLGETVDFASAADVAYLCGVGLFAGAVAALFGLGGGAVAVPALALAFGHFEEYFAATRATSLGMILPTSLVGAALHWKAGNVDLKLVATMAPFALAFAVLGVLVAYAMPSHTLKLIFGLLVIAASVRLALGKPEPES